MEEVSGLFSADDQRLLLQHPSPLAQEDYDAMEMEWWTREPVWSSGVPEELWGLRFLVPLDGDQLMTQEGGKDTTSSEVPEEFRKARRHRLSLDGMKSSLPSPSRRSSSIVEGHVEAPGYEQCRGEPGGCGGAGGRIDGSGALEQCRNRRLVFVGDSLNRNMWESLACILYTALPDRSRARVHHLSSEHKIFRAMDYNCSVEFFWSPFLVQLETKPDRTKVLKLDQLPAMLQQVIGADVLVFNTGHWWTHTGKLRAWDHLERNGMLVKMEGEEAFSRALRTWARWVDHNVDQTRTRVFFRSVSPEHKGHYQLTEPPNTQCSANWCYNQTAPIAADEAIVPWFPKSMVSIVEGSIRSMRTRAAYLNITRLSELRIDAHPSVYSINRDGKPLTLEQRQQPIIYADCSHWCLPGLPDTWNVLLLASLMRHPSSNVNL
uniref:Trichome birefringence-like C-terminal domain-containing protein n=1 Tax=Aegilops tauschii TaxID=37682 RepID=M8C3U8_AEGTA